MKSKLSFFWLTLGMAWHGAFAADLDRIEELRLQGNYQAAIELAQSAVSEDDSNPRLLNLLGELHFDIGQSDLAQRNFQQAIELDALDLLMARLNLARVKLHRGEWDEAEILLRQIWSSYRSQFGLDARDLYAIASATRYLGKTDPQLFKQAVRIFDEAIRRDPSNLDAGIALGELLLEKYNNREASQAFKQVLGKNDEHPRALLGLARSQHFDYSTEAVVTTLNALAINPKLVPARVFMARLFVEQEQYEDARHEAELALEVNPESLQALSLLAVIYHLERNQSEFDRIEQRVLGINPRYAEFYATLADLSAQNRLYQDATGFAAEAIRIDPRSWRAHGLLGLNQMRLGQMASGRASLERSFEGDPYNVWIKNTLQLADSFDRYVEFEQGRFIVMLHGDENDLLGEYVYDLALEAYQHFKARYQHEPEHIIRLEFYPDHADFSVRSVGLAGVGLLGVCFGPVVAMDSPAARSRSAFNWGSTLWHELAHVFHLSITANRVPRWFTEGLAVYEERRARPGWGNDVDPEFLLAYQEGRLLPLSQLNNGFVRPSYPEQVAHSYFQASLVFEFIEAGWGFDIIREILQAYRDTTDPDGLLYQYLQRDSADLDAEFDQFMKTRYATTLASFDNQATELPQPDPDNPPEATEVPEQYFSQLRFGKLLLEQGNLELAEIFLSKAQQLFPQYAGADSSYWLLAGLYLKQQRDDLAEQQLAQMVAINADHYEAQLKLASLLDKRGAIAEAAAALEAAIYIYPYDQQLHQDLASHETKLNRWDKVLRERRALLALDPVDRAEAFYQLAFAYDRAGDRSSAREQILYALEIAPNFFEAQELLLSLRATGQQP